MGLAVNPAKYGKLCADIIPKVIKNDDEFDRMVEYMEKLAIKTAKTPEEVVMSELLATLIQEYDDKHHALPEVPPHQLIAHLMEQRDLRQADMLSVFGSRSVASDVLAGKREPSKAHIRSLAEFFHVSPAVFL